jgi:hypothetical protein
LHYSPHLSNLTKKDSNWKQGSLPGYALRAFWHLQSLTQIDDGAEIFYIIAYASCKLQKHEKNDMPFLLEMQAAFSGKETAPRTFPEHKNPKRKNPESQKW